jgi:multidrug resistance efflux pump
MRTKSIGRGGLVYLLLAVFATACGGVATPTPSSTPVNNAAGAIVTAKGEVVPARYAHVSFGASGTIAQLNAREGENVKAGDVLGQLDTQDLEFQVKTAQDGLALAQSTLAQAKTPPIPEEITSAQAAYDSAVASLEQAQRGPTAEDFAILKANLEKAQAALDQAQAAYDRAGGATNPYSGLLPQSLQLQSATLDYQIAMANYDKATKIDSTAVEQAQAAVTQAKATLELKQKGPRAEDIAVAQVRVQQAQTALDQAQAALAKAKLAAPFDGTITDVSTRAGEMVQAGAPLVTIADLSQLRVETTDLDEFGAAHVKPGEAAKITVNAFSDKVLTGKVTDIALQSVTLPTGDISYVVTLGLDQQDPELRWGMTVKVEFAQQ